MKKSSFRSSLMLLLTAVIWGVAFVAQSAGMDYVGPFTFNAVRSIIGGFVLIPCIFILNRGKPARESTPQSQRDLLVGGVCCGIFLAVASTFQQFGIQYTSVGKAGFITALYILLVPQLGLLFGKRPGWRVWLAVGIAAVRHGGFFDRVRRPACYGLRTSFCGTYPCDRLFFTPRGRRQAVLYPVFHLRPFMRCGDAVVRASHACADPGCLDAHPVRGRHELRGCVHAANHRAARHRPDPCFAHPEPGIGGFGTGGLGAPASVALFARAFRLRAGFLRDHPCAAAGSPSALSASLGRVSAACPRRTGSLRGSRQRASPLDSLSACGRVDGAAPLPARLCQPARTAAGWPLRFTAEKRPESLLLSGRFLRIAFLWLRFRIAQVRRYRADNISRVRQSGWRGRRVQ